jgi:hypothetical protein
MLVSLCPIGCKTWKVTTLGPQSRPVHWIKVEAGDCGILAKCFCGAMVSGAGSVERDSSLDGLKLATGNNFSRDQHF